MAHQIHKVGDYTACIKAFKEDNDNNKAEKAAWFNWFQRVHRSWKVVKDIEEVLNSLGKYLCLLMFSKDGKVMVSGCGYH